MGAIRFDAEVASGFLSVENSRRLPCASAATEAAEPRPRVSAFRSGAAGGSFSETGMNDVLDDTWSGIDVEIRKYSPSQPRDGRGRFTSGAAADDAAQRLDRAAETGLQDAAPGVRVASRVSARELAHLAISHLMDRAGQRADCYRLDQEKRPHRSAARCRDPNCDPKTKIGPRRAIRFFI